MCKVGELLVETQNTIASCFAYVDRVIINLSVFLTPPKEKNSLHRIPDSENMLTYIAHVVCLLLLFLDLFNNVSNRLD